MEGSRLFSFGGLAVQLLILVFAAALIWFTFVYYPGIKGKSASVIFKRPFSQKVLAESTGLPIDTVNYRITYESGTQLYYIFVQGDTIEDYVLNQNSAQLALKNALSVESLCDANIVYSSVARLKLPEKYLTTANCQ